MLKSILRKLPLRREEPEPAPASTPEPVSTPAPTPAPPAAVTPKPKRNYYKGNVILPCLINDIGALYDCYYNAAHDEPWAKLMLEILFPMGITDEFKKVHAEHALKGWHTYKEQYTLKVVDAKTGDIMGMAIQDMHFVEREERERKMPVFGWLEGAQRERAETILNPLWEKKEKLIGGRPHMYGHIIAVDPKYQGRGAGAAIVQWCIDTSNSSGLPFYLEASPFAAPLYTKMGFETLEETIVHKKEVLGTPEDVTVPLMIWMPEAANGMTFVEWRAKGYPAWER
ncbi:hypothetical protein HYFRA_00002195 [Hymenoscyphus fraxineus]|uniref:N-acetyltransferase domain-containing protein n=1 Tax=Hymenoscyphus fraxineus TaxID=746836 RepID=A0A9N9KLD4_9HELO|nr:hypothetical protein HYFRA_00002195 [Hymenoscyphus fraxineus]